MSWTWTNNHRKDTMWILPKQLHISVYAPDTRALVSDSEAFSQLCEKSLTWRGKDSLSRTWLQRWKRESWMQHLCSRTLKPSHTESFVESWTSFPEDSRVSHSQLLESVKLLKTPGTSSPTSQTESESANLELFSSKTLQESYQPRRQKENQFSNMSSENWKAWVTEQRQEYSQRKKSAHLTRESGFSSLGWQTPTTMDIERTPNGMEKRKAYRESIGRKYVEGCLTEQVQNWPTITVNESHNTPCPSQFKRNTPPLGTAVLLDGQQDQVNPNTNGKSQESWPTPRANKVHPEITEKNREHLANRKKANLEEDIAGHCGKATGKLNPNWVEHLMGLPAGWTDLGYWETE